MGRHALLGVVGLLLGACATGTEPTLLLDGLSSGGAAGGDATGNAGQAGDTAQGGGAGSTAGGFSAAGGAAGGLAGSGGAAGAAGTSGSGAVGGSGGAADAGGASGSGGSGGMPAVAEPKSVSVSSTRNATAKQAPSNGGTPYTDDCPENQVLIGFRATIDGGVNSMHSIQGVCGSLSIGPDSPFPVTTMQQGMLPARETAGSTIESAMCPANQVVVGFSGRQAQYLEALIFRCAPLTISGSAPNYQIQVGAAGNTPPVGGENAGTGFNAINCATDQVGVSQVLNAGGAIDNFGLKCSALSLVVQ